MKQPGFLTSGLFGLALLLAGCSPASIPAHDRMATPAIVQQPVLHTSDGTELVMEHWLPATHPVATLLVVHGFNEYAGAFAEVGKALASQDIAVWSFDQRGFGRSPYRGLWSSSERMAADVREAASQLRKANPRQPLYVLGFSMGGAVTLLAAQSGKLDADGILLAAPAVWTSASQPAYQRWAHRLAARLIPGWKPTGENLNIRPSDNRDMLRRLGKDPWIIKGARMDTLHGLVDLMDKGFNAASTLTVPVLLLYGDKDQIIPPKPIKRLWENLPPGKRCFIRYTHGWHMLGRDLNGQEVITDTVNWIKIRNSKPLEQPANMTGPLPCPEACYACTVTH